MDFQKRKAAAVAAINSPATDKSPKGTIDAPIISLLTVINSHPSYFTTSSCSGRISILSQPIASPSAPKKKARGGSWLLVSHDPVQPSSVSTLLFSSTAQRIALDNEPRVRENIVFRFEPLIIAVECENVEAAQSLVSVAISCGFRESGITSVSKRVIIAIRCSIRLEVPLGDTEKLLVTPGYVEYLVEVANDKMKANRKRTDLFHEKLITNTFSGHAIQGNGKLSSNAAETFTEKIEFELVENSVNTGAEIMEAKLEFNRKTDKGSPDAFCINLSVIEVVGESVDRLFLWGHSACMLEKNKITIFGGFGGIGRHARRNDLLLLDIESRTMQIIAAAGAPSPRVGHTSSLVGDFMYVIGGRADPTTILNEVWVFNKVEKNWKLLQCSGSLFPPRHRHSAAVVGSKIYVFGGICNDTILASLYVLDTDTSEWSEVEMRGDQPGPCHSHSMNASGTKLYVFGGNNGEKALGDLYIFDTQTGFWSKQTTKGKSPNSRFSHLMFVYSNYVGILGGCPVGKNQELFLLNLHTWAWKSVEVNSIEESLFIRSTVNVVGDNLIIIGGGASCYAFGTKFSEPMKINLLELLFMCKKSELKALGENHMDYSTGKKSKNPLSSTCRDDQTVDVSANLDPEVEEPGLSNGGSVVASPFVLRIDKQYAKLCKDILKNFGWLDLERKVYSQDSGMHICLPITEKFCIALEERRALGDEFEQPIDIPSLKSNHWQSLLKDISCSEAMKLLLRCGSSKIVDEVIKVKKTPNSPFKVMENAVATLLDRHDQPLELLEQLPARWERLGDIVVLPVATFKDEFWNSVGEELWPLVAQSLGAHRLARQGRIADTGTRDSKLEMLVGDDGWVNHRENGILYSFDATKCMFSWGNLSEKLRMGNLNCKEEVIVDLFAGIGYFVLPFLVRANAKMVYACEWNPHAVEALRRNLQANSVAGRCVVLEGDNRVTAPKGIADRVCLGLLPSSKCSWTTGVRALREEGGMLHIHGNVKDTEESSWTDDVLQSISKICTSEGRFWEVSVEHVERVKWYAPHIRHLVADISCKPSRA